MIFLSVSTLWWKLYLGENTTVCVITLTHVVNIRSIIIDRDTISVYFVFVTFVLYYRPRYYLGLFCFCYCYTLLLFIYLFIIPSNRDPLPHCISKTNNNITIKFLVHTQQCLTTCRRKNSVTFTDDLDPWPWPYHKCAFWAISQYLLDRTSPNFYTG